ncbi:MAG: chromate efflux transporter [Myxococcales bacterium]|nr:chromate efflux transporter [Myxococcales bacterium]
MTLPPGRSAASVGASPEATDGPAEGCSTRDLTLYFLRLGATGFGGPAALVGRMHADLVVQRRWIRERDYEEGLALSQLAPGPLAAQLAIYLGWVRAGVAGAAATSVAFIAPSFVMVVALAALYVRFGGLSWMQGAFYGVGASVIGLMARSTAALADKTLKRDRLLWGVMSVNALSTAVFAKESMLLVVAGGLLVLTLRERERARGRAREGTTPPSTLLPVPALLVSGLHGAAGGTTLLKVLTYFSTAGLFVFGSGLAIVPFLHGGVVDEAGWLSERQFMDAVAVAMLTPGPVVITVGFIGYLVAGLAGATLAAIGVFVPCFLVVVLAAPHYRRLVASPRVKAFVQGVTSGAVGAVAGSVFVLARRALVDVPTVLIALATLALVVRVKKVPEPAVIALAAALGMALSHFKAS